MSDGITIGKSTLYGCAAVLIVLGLISWGAVSMMRGLTRKPNAEVAQPVLPVKVKAKMHFKNVSVGSIFEYHEKVWVKTSNDDTTVLYFTQTQTSYVVPANNAKPQNGGEPMHFDKFDEVDQ